MSIINRCLWMDRAWAVTLFYSQLIRVSLFGQCFITCARLVIISSVIIELMAHYNVQGFSFLLYTSSGRQWMKVGLRYNYYYAEMTQVE